MSVTHWRPDDSGLLLPERFYDRDECFDLLLREPVFESRHLACDLISLPAFPDLLFDLRNNEIRGRDGSVTELNTMLNKFGQTQQMMKKMGKFQKMTACMGGRMPGMLRR